MIVSALRSLAKAFFFNDDEDILLSGVRCFGGLHGIMHQTIEC
jgi:hypothetical protein